MQNWTAKQVSNWLKEKLVDGKIDSRSATTVRMLSSSRSAKQVVRVDNLAKFGASDLTIDDNTVSDRVFNLRDGPTITIGTCSVASNSGSFKEFIPLRDGILNFTDSLTIRDNNAASSRIMNILGMSYVNLDANTQAVNNIACVHIIHVAQSNMNVLSAENFI